MVLFYLWLILKYLKNTEANLCNVLVIIVNFNIKDWDWDSFYFFHLVYSDLLLDIANLFDLKLSVPIQQVLNCYANNFNNVNLVINLIFLYPNLSEIDNHQILPKLWYLLDYASLVVNIFWSSLK